MKQKLLPNTRNLHTFALGNKCKIYVEVTNKSQIKNFLLILGDSIAIS